MCARIGSRMRCFAALAALTVGSERAVADFQEPGSLLLFQEFDNRPGVTTLFTVTNSNPSAQVRVKFEYFDGLECLEFNRTQVLTPEDTLTLVTEIHNPEHERGYAFAFAEDPAGQAIGFDHLIGTALVIDGIAIADYSVNPFVFRSASVAQGAPTDLNGNGERDLDGVEYSRGPDELVFPRFLGQEAGTFASDLLLIDLSGGLGFSTHVQLLLWNDNEEMFSAGHEFSCWTRVPLTNVSNAFSNAFLQSTNHDPDEVGGATTREAGWFRVDGQVSVSPTVLILEPLVLGLLVDRINGSRVAGRPYFVGEQDPGNSNLAPQCQPDFALTLEDLPVEIRVLANDTDPEGELDCSSLTIAVPPAHGVALFGGCGGIACPDCVVTYVPDPGFSGFDGFVYRVSDAQGATTEGCPVTIEVQEVVDPPACPEGVSVELWPPNHQYVELDLDFVAGVVDPGGLPVTIVITAITQDEPVDGQGDGNTVCDGTGVGGSRASIRSERRGGGNGRVYHVHYTATNSGGASCSGALQVSVPRSSNGDPAVDDGQAFDSTEGC